MDTNDIQARLVAVGEKIKAKGWESERIALVKQKLSAEEKRLLGI